MAAVAVEPGSLKFKVQSSKLSRGPGEGAAAEDVAMEVRDGFAGVGAVVDDEAKTGFVEAEFSRYFGGFEQQMAEGLFVLRLRGSDVRDGFFWDDEHVRRRLGRDVAKGEDEFIFVNDVRGNLARDDFFEESHGLIKEEKLKM